MKTENSVSKWLFRNAGVFALLLFILISSTTATKAQKLPPLLSEGSADPSAFNIDSIKELKKQYEDNAKGTSEANKEAAKQYRNRLVGICIDQVDALYFDKLKSDRKKIRLVQFILDFLEIGAASAISITNGERAKTVISEGLGTLQASRKSLNKNFQLLERNLLINKMEANRATTLTSILGKLNRNVIEYPWEMASADLRAYRDAGTLDSALASLSAGVGKERISAEENLREVKDKPLTRPATKADFDAAKSANKAEVELEKELKDTDKKAAALKTLQDIVENLVKDEEIAKLLKDRGISSTTDDGQKIIDALDDIKGTDNISRDLVQKINLVIVEVNSKK